MSPDGYQVAAFYFPGFHPDPRTGGWHGDGWTEWELTRRARPRFPGHYQPRVPLWGELDESDPATAERQIAAAADHGISAFIYDWYWYADRPFLQGALDRGFLQAANNDRIKFSVMWANHDWMNIFPLKRSNPPALLESGTVDAQTFRNATDHLIDNYFGHPSYWLVDGAPFLSIYDLRSLVEGLGGIDAAAAALQDLRDRAAAAGFPAIHLNAIGFTLSVLPGEHALPDAAAVIDRLGFDSVTSYVWVHHVGLDSFPTIDYAEYAARAAATWPELARQYSAPYFPNVTVGWDPSPRTVQSDAYDDLGYTFTPVLADASPDRFRQSLLAARDFLDRSAAPLGGGTGKILTINAWNEWTEGSYLEPDSRHGYGFLEAIRDVFGGPVSQA